ncbi:GIY-YIG nuclease family protein [Carboxylicivirga caseinilyticus]|uniref:GIY-YIG nuclease family protein n=1 Tax=Carboxylicivirga caseinilyticus TaxID=3417572 RepID=UPI003D33E516|nr:GIY-YIG nuclease family protein [Marinilabiliaceae bacterium A049]
MYFIYILYSLKSDRYYIGYSPDPHKRLLEHNSYRDKSKYTAKHQPWELKCFFEVSNNISDAIRVERFIKNQKSKVFLKKLIAQFNDPEFIQSIIINATR